jgi:hypothetical protein
MNTLNTLTDALLAVKRQQEASAAEINLKIGRLRQNEARLDDISSSLKTLAIRKAEVTDTKTEFVNFTDDIEDVLENCRKTARGMAVRNEFRSNRYVAVIQMVAYHTFLRDERTATLKAFDEELKNIEAEEAALVKEAEAIVAEQTK